MDDNCTCKVRATKLPLAHLGRSSPHEKRLQKRSSPGPIAFSTGATRNLLHLCVPSSLTQRCCPLAPIYRPRDSCWPTETCIWPLKTQNSRWGQQAGVQSFVAGILASQGVALLVQHPTAWICYTGVDPLAKACELHPT